MVSAYFEECTWCSADIEHNNSLTWLKWRMSVVFSVLCNVKYKLHAWTGHEFILIIFIMWPLLHMKWLHCMSCMHQISSIYKNIFFVFHSIYLIKNFLSIFLSFSNKAKKNYQFSAFVCQISTSFSQNILDLFQARFHVCSLLNTFSWHMICIEMTLGLGNEFTMSMIVHLFCA